jgi:3-oxo-5-alpha-steroid 4-dehydrogenase 3 / polyprenol reductase
MVSGQILFVAVVPPLSSRFLSYGARAIPAEYKEERKDEHRKQQINPVTTFLDRLAAIKVPHAYFTSFYVVCLSACLIWATQIPAHGPLYRFVVAYTNRRRQTMPIRRVFVAWLMLTTQGSRRLYESLQFARPSTSQMWIVHCLLGWAFYAATSVAVWVEGIRESSYTCPSTTF